MKWCNEGFEKIDLDFESKIDRVNSVYSDLRGDIQISK